MGICCLSQISRLIYIQENRFLTCKTNKHRFHYKYLLICQEATNIFKKNEQHDINKLFNGILNEKKPT